MIDWIKLSTRMFEDEKIRIILSMPDGTIKLLIWLKLLTQAGKVNDYGFIYLNEDIPYTNEMLSVVFDITVEEISEALKTLSSLKMIDVSQNNIIRICNWEKYQNVEGMKRAKEMNKERVKRFREKKKLEGDEGNENKEESIDKNCNDDCNGNVMDEKEKETQKENEEIKNEKLVEEKEENKNTDDLLKKLKEFGINTKGLSVSVLQKLLDVHDERYILLAAIKAIEKNKHDINYIKGILKNWTKNGYPEEELGISSDGCIEISREKPKLRFNNFEARKYDYDDLEEKLLGWK